MSLQDPHRSIHNRFVSHKPYAAQCVPLHVLLTKLYAQFFAHHDPMQDRETVVLPRRPDAASALNMATLSIHMVLEFKSETLRSGAVVMSDDAPAGSALLFLRGAPAVIASLVDPASIPADFEQVKSAKWADGGSNRNSYHIVVCECAFFFRNVVRGKAFCTCTVRVCLCHALQDIQHMVCCSSMRAP